MVTSAPGDQDLLSIATTQLENLLQGGRIFWEESTPEYVEHNGFKVRVPRYMWPDTRAC